MRLAVSTREWVWSNIANWKSFSMFSSKKPLEEANLLRLAQGLPGAVGKGEKSFLNRKKEIKS